MPTSPHPTRPGQIAVIREIDPPVYRLPPDLAPGTMVRVLSFDCGSWIVESVEEPGPERWRVYLILLEVS